MQISALYVYPIKACAGIALPSAHVVERGFELDRRWMVVDEGGRFMSQRETPRLALVRPRLATPGFVLARPDGRELELPLSHEVAEVVTVQVWEQTMRAVRHAPGSLWFSEFLDRAVSLVYMPVSERRPTKRGNPSDIVSFADVYPFLLISQESLDELNRRLEHPLDMRRFRPNIVISGGSPHVEDGFARVRVGPIWFRGPKRCDRCAVTTVDPDSAERGKEPLRTLAKYRQEDGKVWFGMNLIHEGVGTLRLGDAVEP
ncbi:MAG TPA: MOSC N-terminal beta barrel domain-containing protein, partial [Polyangiaceae bacterium]